MIPRGRTSSSARPVLFQTGVRRRRPVRRRLLLAAGGVVLLLLIAIVVASWLLSGLLIDPHHDLVKDNIKTMAVGRGRIVLARTRDSQRNGVYGLDWPAGHAVVGGLILTTPSTVTRHLMSLTGRLPRHAKVGLDPNVWTTNPRAALGLDYRSVTFPDPLGRMPAWLVAGRGSTWVIFVHGIDGTRAGGLRPLAALHGLGFPTLLIDYRNDVGAPASPDGHIQLGMTEWQDLDAAVRWAIQQGAQRLVLYGDSMGGSIVTRFMHLSPLSGKVSALVLDAPVLDWAGVIDDQASRRYLPFMAPPVKWMVGARIDVSWSALDQIAQARSFHLPILLFQGTDDALVPSAQSRDFARTAPGPVSYVPVRGAGHIESWNANPTAYESHLRKFLAPDAPPPGKP
jgi:alpha-beta hydrolase superfamily lysophospholipase